MKPIILSTLFLLGFATTGCGGPIDGEFADEDLQEEELGTASQALTAKSVTNDVMLVNAKTGKCLTIAGGVSTDNNVTAVQFDCDSDPSRTWRISDVTGSGVYQLRNVQTNRCLTIAGGVSTDNNVTALQFSCDADVSRRWTIRLKL